MKKLLTTLVLTSMMVIPSSALSVMINGSPLQSDVAPRIVEGRTMLPARAIAENLYSVVNWDSKTKTATILKKDTEIELKIDNKIAKVNGEEVELDVPAKIINGRTMIPISFVAKNMGLNVDWDNTTKTASINSEIMNKVVEEKTEIKEEENLSENLDTPTPSQNTSSQTYRDINTVYVDEKGNGLIKGNINSKKEKIYHVPGMPSYNKTRIDTRKGEEWFKTERQAQEAGFRMPLNN